MGEKERTAGSLLPEDAFETGAPEGTLGAEEELWLADPETLKLSGGAQKILAAEPAEHFSGELVDCEVEANTGIHREASGVGRDLISRRKTLLEHAGRLNRVLGTSGTHPLGDWREQEIIDKPHYQRLKRKLGWLIRRNNTFSLHVHYGVQGKEKVIYLFDRIREYVPHFLALSANSPFWQGEFTDTRSARALIFSRSLPHAGMPEPFGSWEAYANYLDFIVRPGIIQRLGEIWWDIRPHPRLSTLEIRAFDAQTDPARSEALISLAAATCDMLCAEYESGQRRPVRPVREIEDNKWSAQRHGLDGFFVDHDTHEPVPARRAAERLLELVAEGSRRNLSGTELLLEGPTESERQLAVWRETGSVREVVRDIVRRTSDAII
ncbi:Putative glutamate--cysteine ligase 2 [Rubrobacter xylanophilus DSM 9941]|uniref:carboxylate-amine ligase n=1 Tax=Rubrobacter xylanophilus TaxID=49319 RepID=UPI001C63BCEA|nr:YbdK family carboxylate-amine ligase [Rubrobacter xylanophilus]QYJ14368.1 Putative glutamate--cysteine ligase 2 [Rubrobacter xylanophilus DSM 9941]